LFAQPRLPTWSCTSHLFHQKYLPRILKKVDSLLIHFSSAVAELPAALQLLAGVMDDLPVKEADAS
jgi:hypothetical protein